MWEHYTKNTTFEKKTTKDEIRRQPENVHAYLKGMEEGPESRDAQTLKEYAKGAMTGDDEKMRNYLIK